MTHAHSACVTSAELHARLLDARRIRALYINRFLARLAFWRVARQPPAATAPAAA